MKKKWQIKYSSIFISRKIVISDTSPLIFRRLLLYLYGAPVDKTVGAESICELMLLADRFSLDILKVNRSFERKEKYIWTNLIDLIVRCQILGYMRNNTKVSNRRGLGIVSSEYRWSIQYEYFESQLLFLYITAPRCHQIRYVLRIATFVTGKKSIWINLYTFS